MLGGTVGEWEGRGLPKEDATGGVFIADTPGNAILGMVMAAGAGLYCGVGRVVDDWVGGGWWYEYRKGLGLTDADERSGLGRMCKRVML